MDSKLVELGKAESSCPTVKKFLDSHQDSIANNDREGLFSYHIVHKLPLQNNRILGAWSYCVNSMTLERVLYLKIMHVATHLPLLFLFFGCTVTTLV